MSWMTGFVCGCALWQLIAGLSHAFLFYISLCLSIAAILCWAWPRHAKFLLAFLLGSSYLFAANYLTAPWVLPYTQQAKAMLVQGWVASPAKIYPDHTRISFKLESTNHSNGAIVLLNIYHYSKNLKLQVLRVGDRYKWRVKLKRPHGYANPGSFPMESWARQQGISAKGYVLTHKPIKYLGHCDNCDGLLQWRIQLSSKIKNVVSNPSYAAIFNALILGLRNNINPSTWQLFRNTGTSHLLAISGLHLALIAWIAQYFFAFGWRCIPAACEILPAQKFAAAMSILLAVIYSVISGFAVPAERALIMLSLFHSRQLFGCYWRGFDAWRFALLLAILLGPQAFGSASFILSFMAVGCLIYGMSGRLAANSLWWKHGRSHLLMFIGLLPITAWYFKQLSLLSIAANLIALPIIGLLVLPIALLATLSLQLALPFVAVKLFAVASIALHYVLQYLQYLAASPHSILPLQINELPLVVCMIICVLVMFAPLPMLYRLTSALGLLPLFFTKAIRPVMGSAYINVLDVGQGLSVVVRTHKHTLLYDTGPSFGASYDTAKAIILPFLNTVGVQTLDSLVISHPDNDHAGGAKTIMQSYHPANIYSSTPQRFSARAMYCLRGISWQWDGVSFKFLYPDMKHLKLDNNSSCVLRISVAQYVVLLTGDIEAPAEKIIVKTTASKQLHTDVLVVPHHGSTTSSTSSFLGALQAKLGVVASGYLNRFHFPRTAIVARYQQHKINLLNTATCGMASVDLTKQGIRNINCYRNNRERGDTG